MRRWLRSLNTPMEAPSQTMPELQDTTMTGVKKKLVTEWTLFDKILIIGGMFFINFVT
ncbi:hypothetical protein H4S06_003326, partial [Coemansia sp. BCRC 34490]